MSDATDRKARRIERIRGEIMNAAIEIISSKGYKNTTTKEISEKSDMAEGTLYNYFKNKDDILLSIAERYVSYKRNLEVSTDVNSVEEFIGNLYSANNSQLAEEHGNDRNVLKALLPEFLTDTVLGKMYFDRIVSPYLNALEKKLTILQEKGIVADYNVKALSRLLYSSLIGFAVLELNKDPVTINATPEFKKNTGRTYIEVLGKGMSAE
jgi:AcrR family transcriptional regulator